MQPTYSTDVNTGVDVSDIDEQGRLARAKNKVTDALGRAGRRVKRIEVRESIVEHPLPAVGIAAAVGAAIALIRPMPERGRVSSLVMATLGAIGIRLVKEAALGQLGDMAKNYLTGRQNGGESNIVAPSGVAAKDVRTTTY